MNVDFGTVRKALRSQCRVLADVLRNLPEADFARPTRLQPWDVLHLVAHLYRDLERVPMALQAPLPGIRADTDAVTYWHYDRTENASRTQARADLIVHEYGNSTALARAFVAVQQRANELLENADPLTIVRTWEPVMRLDDFAATRVVEVAIHGLDLRDAIEQMVELDDDGMEITSSTLLELLGAPLPPGLAWGRTTWIEKGSGRIPLTSEERTALGRQADRFPLLA